MLATKQTNIPAKVVTLGCRLNAFESEVMRETAAREGITDAVIVNTCAVTAEAERQARQTIRKLARQYPDTRIVVTGCAAQLNPVAFAAMEEVDRVLGNAEKLDPAQLSGADALNVSDIMLDAAPVDRLITGFEGRARAFVQIQQGCDHRCTYCIIPFARGPAISMPPERIVTQVRAMVAAGHREVVLTGVDISSYDGGGLSLGALTGKILADIPELDRLRLSTVDPAVADDALIRLFTEDDRLMPHLHLSLQSMDDMVLKRMKRRHDRRDVFRLAERLREARPDIVLGADFITGFPTETDGMAANTERAAEDLGLVHLHVFPFSSRPGTPAAKMPPVPAGHPKARAARLRQIGDQALDRFLRARIGETVEVLVEDANSGHCRHYAHHRLAFDARPGDIVTVTVTGVEDGAAVSEMPS